MLPVENELKHVSIVVALCENNLRPLRMNLLNHVDYTNGGQLTTIPGANRNSTAYTFTGKFNCL